MSLTKAGISGILNVLIYMTQLFINLSYKTSLPLGFFCSTDALLKSGLCCLYQHRD